MSLEKRISTTAMRFNDKLTKDKINQVLDYSDNHGEYGLAVEMLCDFLIGEDISLVTGDFEDLQDLAAHVGVSLHSGVVKYLKSLVES
ncbi:MafI family immunity protein [Litoreibacter sp.]|nr:MafI family immunity protein [Litoreibacter sp.]